MVVSPPDIQDITIRGRQASVVLTKDCQAEQRLDLAKSGDPKRSDGLSSAGGLHAPPPPLFIPPLWHQILGGVPDLTPTVTVPVGFPAFRRCVVPPVVSEETGASEGAALYSIQDNNRTEDCNPNGLKVLHGAWVGRLSQLKLTRWLYDDVLAEILGRNCWKTGTTITSMARSTLTNWKARLAECSREGWTEICQPGGHVRVHTNCCHVPLCPSHQRRRSREWVDRASTLVGSIHQAKGLAWRLVTLSLRPLGDFDRDIDATVELRRSLARVLRRDYGMTAGFGAIEKGEGRNVHLHFLIYSSFVPRATIQKWLRGQDCSVQGCSHPLADDRCDVCRSSGVACDHLCDGRVRCNGSWVVDARLIRGAGGVREVLKYATAPVVPGGVPHPDEPFSGAMLNAAEEVVLFYLALKGRHRVETYGLARPRVERADAGAEELDSDAASSGVCACGCPFVFVATWTMSSTNVLQGIHGIRNVSALGP